MTTTESNNNTCLPLRGCAHVCCCSRWSNIYSKHLLRVLYASEGNTDDFHGNANPGKNQGREKRAANESFGQKAGSKTERSDYTSVSLLIIFLFFTMFRVSSFYLGQCSKDMR